MVGIVRCVSTKWQKSIHSHHERHLSFFILSTPNQIDSGPGISRVYSRFHNTLVVWNLGLEFSTLTSHSAIGGIWDKHRKFLLPYEILFWQSCAKICKWGQDLLALAAQQRGWALSEQLDLHGLIPLQEGHRFISRYLFLNYLAQELKT